MKRVMMCFLAAGADLQKVASLVVPQPPIDEQKQFAAQMKTEFDEVTTLRERLAQKHAAVEKLPAALLREAFSGRG
jgi:restriction endonuclease S subunit